MSGHTHVWIHVAATDWRGRQIIIARCSCGDTLTPVQITELRHKMGLPA